MNSENKPVAWPKVCGTARIFDNPRALLVMMEREPTDAEMRAFDDSIKGFAVHPAPSEPSEAISTAVPTNTWTVIAPDGTRFEGETPFRAASAANKHLGRSLYDPEKAAEFQALIADVRRESEAESVRLRAEHGSLDCPTCGGSGHVGDALARPALSDEPPFDLVDRCAQRIAAWEGNCTWPDSWDSADVARMRLEAKRVLLEARAWLGGRHTPSEPSEAMVEALTLLGEARTEISSLADWRPNWCDLCETKGGHKSTCILERIDALLAAMAEGAKR